MSLPAASRPSDHGMVLRFGSCELHVLTREFWREGQRVPIPRRVFDLLLLLIEQRPRPVSRSEIARAVWGRAEVRASALAQAVMQARQGVGDVGEEPAVIVSVRGVGYRFAGAVAEGAPEGVGLVPPSALDELHSLMADAEAARLAGDLERAQFLADRAVVQAQDTGINRERARALSLAALVAITRGTLQEAAGLAAQALRLAEAERLPDVAAEARLRVARVRMIAGDLHGALAQLHAAYAMLRDGGTSGLRCQNERLFALAYREMAQHAQALAWCDSAEQTALQAHDPVSAGTVRTLRVDVTLQLAEARTQQGQHAEAAAACERALDLNAAIRNEVQVDPDPSALLAWLGNQAIALGGLGRTDEAWDALARMQHLLDTAPRTYGPAHPLWLSGLHRERAAVLARTRRHAEALAALEQAVQVAEAGGLRTELPLLLLRGSRVCEAAGRFQEALAWLHRSHAAQQALQLERAASQALVLQAEAEADTLRRDLQAALQQAQQLALENRMLNQRLQRLERRQALDGAGFADADAIRNALQPRHADARARDVPWCLALLVVDNRAALPPADGAAVPPWLRELARACSEVLGPLHEIVHWQPGLFVHVLPDLGERRAREACQRAELRLAAYPWRRGAAAAPEVPRLRLVCVDAARDETLDAALQRLRRLADAAAQSDGSGQARALA